MPIKHGGEWLYFEKEVADLVEQGRKDGINKFINKFCNCNKNPFVMSTCMYCQFKKELMKE